MHDRPLTPLKQRFRQWRLFAPAIAGYAVGAALMFSYAMLGIVPLDAALLYVAAGIGLNLALAIWIRQRGHRRRRDNPLPVGTLLLLNAAVQLIFVVWVPQIGGLLILVLVGLLPVEPVRVGRRRIVALSLTIAAMALAAFVLADGSIGIPTDGMLQQFIAWATFALVLVFTTALNLVKARIGGELTERNLQIREEFKSFRDYAFKDDLTGLANRRAFQEQLAHHLRRFPDRHLAVALIDLDRFKAVNDRLGHAVGDRLLVEVGKRLRHALRQGDLLARLGGDEFVVLLTDYAAEQEVRPVASRLVKSLEAPVQIDSHRLQIGMSLGLVLHRPDDPVDSETLMRRADLAMYAAKEGGRQQYRLFDQQMETALQDRERKLLWVLAALHDNRLELHYQPVLSVHPKRDSERVHIHSAEALLRLRDESGLHTAAEFEAVLDDEQISLAVGRFVLDTVLAQAERWHLAERTVQVSVNISPRHFLDPQFLSDLRAALERYPRCPPNLLTLELTEHGSELDSTMARFVVSRCRRLGVRVSLDDFGTGSASLTHLQELEVSSVKIDRTFTRDLFTSGAGLSIAYGLLRTGHLMSLNVIAEGVSTVQHALALVAMACRHLQGFAIARPMPADVFADWLAHWQERIPWATVLAEQALLEPDAIQALVQHSTTVMRAERGDLTADDVKRLSQPDAQMHCALGVWCRAKSPQFENDHGFKRLVREHHVFHTRLREYLALRDHSTSGDLNLVRDQGRLVRHRFWNLMLVNLEGAVPQQEAWANGGSTSGAGISSLPPPVDSRP